MPAAPAFQFLSLLPRLLSHVTQWSCGRYSQPPAAHLSLEDQPLTPAWALLVHWPGVLLQQPERLEAAEAPAHLSLPTLSQAQSFSLRPPQLGTGERAAKGGAGRVMGKEGPEAVAWGEP